jgi:hypothetical protein
MRAGNFMRLMEKLQAQRLQAVVALLHKIAELELVSPPDRAEIDRLNAQLNFLLSEDGGSPMVQESHDPPRSPPHH